jgi:hypothetical protein
MEIITDGERSVEPRTHVRRGKMGNKPFFTAMPLEIRPLAISAQLEIDELKASIRAFLEDTLTVSLAHIASDIH